MSAAADLHAVYHELRPCSAPSRRRYHPLCELIAIATDDRLAELAEDIKANGLIDPVVLLDGAVLDGRNRLLACGMAKVAPHFAEYVGDAPAAYVASKNLKRRDLTHEQRLAAAAKLLPKLKEEAAERKRAGVSARVRGGSEETGKASEIAAKAAGVGARSVEKMAKVQAEGVPELGAAVETGRISVSAANDLASLSREEQLRAIGMSEVEIAATVRALRRKRAADSASSSDSEEWYSPEDPVEAARVVMGGTIALDPASCAEANEVIRAVKFFTQKQDGLTRDWCDRWWLNNPYGFRKVDGKKFSNMKLWTEKALAELAKGHRGIQLINANVGEAWFRPLFDLARCFPRRLRFRAPEAIKKAEGKEFDSPRHSNVIVNYGFDPLLFKRVFEERGIGIVDIPVIVIADQTISDLQRLLRDNDDQTLARRIGEVYANNVRKSFVRAEAR